MSTVAEQLRHAREARNLSVQQVAEITKIRTDHLSALEEGNFDVFSAPVYIRGFVRTYSTLLKLDVPKVMATLDAELGQTRKFAEPPPLTNRPRGVVDFLTLQLSKLDLRRGLVVLSIATALAAIVLVYVIIRHQRSADPLKNLKPGMYEPARSGPTLPLPATPARK